MYRCFWKRVFDFCGAIVLCPFVLLVICVVGPLIYLEDKGSIFYNAPRIGKDGRPFRMFKLRSMRMNAPDIRLEDGSTYNGEDDPRVTKIGKFIRKTSIDELPQIFNVLKGDMSFIGHRPDPLDWMERYPEECRGLLAVRPGITGYNQAYFRNSDSVDLYEKMCNSYYYATHVSLRLDLKILLQTVRVVVKQENIYRNRDSEQVLQEK